MPGSCTEGLVSHILSKRFSREPQGWSDEGLGRLSNIRVYLINGGELKADDLHKERPDNAPREKYAEYADRVIQHSKEELHDWSIFDGEPVVMDGASGTQMLIRGYGAARDLSEGTQPGEGRRSRKCEHARREPRGVPGMGCVQLKKIWRSLGDLSIKTPTTS